MSKIKSILKYLRVEIYTKKKKATNIYNLIT